MSVFSKYTYIYMHIHNDINTALFYSKVILYNGRIYNLEVILVFKPGYCSRYTASEAFIDVTNVALKNYYII